jgi:hypothetical protein
MSVSVQLNIELQSEHAQLRVEVLDRQFRPVPGLSGADAVLLRSNGESSKYSAFRQSVSWAASAAIPITQSLRAFRLRVVFEGVRPQDARLYTMYAQLHDKHGSNEEGAKLELSAM